MTKTLDNYDWGQKHPGRESKYPWDEWTDGQVYLAEQDKDYTCKLESFRDGLREHGHRNEMKVRTRVHPEGVVFQFYKEE